jgi:AmmeMemoRadiSam system protein A
MLRLNNSERQLLLKVARDAVHRHLSGLAFERPEVPDGVMTKPLGVFVSIHSGAELRGCIGRIQPEKPLVETTAECAISAAVADPRFPPLEFGELPHVSFEVSALSPLKEIDGVEQIEVGLHGLLVEKGSNRGLLLPQVATRYGWDPHEFLSQTCLKAGLGPDDWKDDATLFAFEALVFDETSSPATAS